MRVFGCVKMDYCRYKKMNVAPRYQLCIKKQTGNLCPCLVIVNV